MDAFEIRRRMAALGWRSNDDLSDQGWGGKFGYSFWFTRWDWHGHRLGVKASYGRHTSDLQKIPEMINEAAELALKAWDEFPEYPPDVLVDGTLKQDEHILRFVRELRAQRRS